MEIREWAREWLGVCGAARLARQILVASVANRVAPRASRRREAAANLRLVVRPLGPCCLGVSPLANSHRA